MVPVQFFHIMIPAHFSNFLETICWEIFWKLYAGNLLMETMCWEIRVDAGSFLMETLSKKRRSRGRGRQQEDFHSNGIEVDSI